MASVMLTATQARNKAQNDLVIFNEVRDIELAILTASADGAYEATINETTMTSSLEYFNVWKGVTPSRSKEVQMSIVIKYFSDLGYSIERKVNLTSGNTFDWQVFW